MRLERRRCAYYASGEEQRNDEAATIFGAGAFDPPATRAALATLRASVLLVDGELDAAAPPRVVAEMAGLFPNVRLATQPGSGHYPWLDDPAGFTTTIATPVSLVVHDAPV